MPLASREPKSEKRWPPLRLSRSNLYSYFSTFIFHLSLSPPLSSWTVVVAANDNNNGLYSWTTTTNSQSIFKAFILLRSGHILALVYMNERGVRVARMEAVIAIALSFGWKWRTKTKRLSFMAASTQRAYAIEHAKATARERTMTEDLNQLSVLSLCVQSVGELGNKCDNNAHW